VTRVYIVEDNETLRIGMVTALDGAGMEVQGFADGPAALRALEADPADIVITDLKMTPMDGLQVLERVKASRPEIEVLVVTAYGSIETAVEAMKLGATDFLQKPFSLEALEVKVRRLAETQTQRLRADRAEAETHYLRGEVQRRFAVDEIVGESQAMQSIFAQIRKVAPSDAAVLITGESGTGKELAARALHRNSSRAETAFISVNCGALAEGVLESELFGHEKGAFTGATRQRKGRFELAHGGTLFLDEVGEVPPGTQVKLLRVLQEKAFERVGGEETLKVDVRIVAATNRDLQAEVSTGRFREDLFYRLHVIPLHMPPLRERPGDIPLLARFFLGRMTADRGLPAHSLSPSAEEVLVSYHWPGNVRELENVMERALVLSDSTTIEPDDIPVTGRRDVPRSLPLPDEDLPLNQTLASLEERLILRALARSKGVKAEAARLLGIKESALYYKLEKYGMKE
jgi:DNA-binding NtrC family response regulator